MDDAKSKDHQRLDAALLRLLKTPPKPREELKLGDKKRTSRRRRSQARKVG